jgi:alpha-beta hydrolase superfamily lysophospholipase
LYQSIGVILVLSLFAFVSYGCDGGSSNVCSETISVSNASGARLFYPCNISSSVGATTLTSGYTGTYSQVEWLAEDMVKNGYVVLAMTPSNIYGMVSGWRDAHKSGIARLQSLNQSHRTLAGRINQSKLQTCGHSKGGGGALWASTVSPKR